ncbi:uncharacterized protein LOC143563675 [Bidens hawaiensis]|uniref:uncharacterized protein LOC143563675 n=1 Tax=Bidens hawaiensis TaxID=980011 RepID=UPI00404B5B87
MIPNNADSEDDETESMIQAGNAKPNDQAETAEEKREADERAKVHQSLYEAALSQSFETVRSILRDGKVSVTDKIAINGNTVLHLVVGITKGWYILEKMLEMVPEGSTLLGMRNSEGSTLLHVAAIVGNTQAAKILVRKNQDLLYAKDNEGQTPLARALSNMHTETYLYLLDPTPTSTPDLEMANCITGDELLVNAISSKDYDSALVLMTKHYRSFDSDAVLMAIAQNFPRRLNTWERAVNRLFRGPEDLFGVMLHVIQFASLVFIIVLHLKTKAIVRSMNRWLRGCFYAAIVIGTYAGRS